MKTMKISELIEKLEKAKEHLGDVEVYFLTNKINTLCINAINYEGDHIELSN